MTDQDEDQAKQEAEKAKELKERGIPPEMEEHEAKGGYGNNRLQSEVATGKPDGPGGETGQSA